MKQKIGEWYIEAIDDMNYALYKEAVAKTGKRKGEVSKVSVTYHHTIEDAVMKIARVEANKADDLRGFLESFKMLVVELKEILKGA